jgi:hypothetical protein
VIDGFELFDRFVGLGVADAGGRIRAGGWW